MKTSVNPYNGEVLYEFKELNKSELEGNLD